MMRRYAVSAVALVAITALSGLAQAFKLNTIVGLVSGAFSWSHCVMPLIGCFFGVGASSLMFFSILMIKSFGFMHYAYYGLPTFAASLVWSPIHKVLRIGVPALCMVLFLIHPVGRLAMPYTFYWFIPMVAAFVSEKKGFITALASTFTAHAVGSVLHLYLINAMTPAAWLSLIPQVAVERLVFALGMYVVYGVVMRLLVSVFVLLQKKCEQCPVLTD